LISESKIITPRFVGWVKYNVPKRFDVMGPRFVGWVKYNVPNDSMCVGHGWSLCPTYAVGNTNSLIFASAGMTRLPSRYEAPPRKVACEALPQNNTLQNTQGGAMLTSFRGRATERV